MSHFLQRRVVFLCIPLLRIPLLSSNALATRYEDFSYHTQLNFTFFASLKPHKSSFLFSRNGHCKKIPKHHNNNQQCFLMRAHTHYYSSYLMIVIIPINLIVINYYNRNKKSFTQNNFFHHFLNK